MFAPFDKILVTAGATALPENLINQLAIGGYLVIPIGGDDVQTMWRYTKVTETEIKSESFGKFKFVPFLKGTQQQAILFLNSPAGKIPGFIFTFTFLPQVYHKARECAFCIYRIYLILVMNLTKITFPFLGQ